MNDQRLRDLEQRVQDLVQRVPNLPDRLARGAGGAKPRPRLQIDGATVFDDNDNRWEYDWTLMAWDSASSAWVATEITSATAGYTTARNCMEDNNPDDLTTATGTLPIGLTLPITDGSTMMPFGSTAGQEAIVEADFFLAVVGEGEEAETLKRPIFCQANSFDCGA